MYDLLRPALFRLEAETAHHLSLRALAIAGRSGLAACLGASVPAQPVRLMGLDFPNPVGLAAGLDKNGEAIDGLAALGFGFVEIGTVTPRPQPGNPRPRLFRIPERQAIINRMGFNNAGVDHLLANVQASRFRGVLGINIGKNFDTPLESAVDDYLSCLRRVYPLASYVTVNLSSPNTPGLRDLQFGEPLERLLAALKEEQAKLASEHGAYRPLVLKIAPDMADDDIASVAASLLGHGIDGVIATNTTIAREGVEGLPNAGEKGGLSGAPLAEKSTRVVEQLSLHLGGRLPIIAAGGITDARTAADKIRAGASLVQIYSGFIYRGPRLIAEAADGVRAAQALAAAGCREAR